MRCLIDERSASWRATVAHAGGAAAVMLGMVYYWFAVADRYAVFLYGHVDRPGDLPAAPFGPITRSRYWMSGFVAAGVIMVLYAAIVGLAAHWMARRGRPFTPPKAAKVWVCAAPILVVGVPAITMTQNRPTLPAHLAAAVTGTAVLGLVLALWPAGWAARRPTDLAWLALDGLGLVPPLLLWRAIELPARGILSAPITWAVVVGSIAGGAVWLGLMTAARARSRRATPAASEVFGAGVTWVVLGVPLAHHLLFTPPAYRYITSAPNVFGFTWQTWISALLVAAALAAGATWCRRR